MTESEPDQSKTIWFNATAWSVARQTSRAAAPAPATAAPDCTRFVAGLSIPILPKSRVLNSNFTMSVDVFLLINLLALFHRNTALPARLPSSGRAPRTSCVIPEPRLLKLHSRFPTDHSDVSPGVHPHRDLPSCHQPNGYRPRLDKMVSAKAPHWRGAQAQAQWLLKRGCRLLLLLMVLTFDYPLPF